MVVNLKYLGVQIDNYLAWDKIPICTIQGFSCNNAMKLLRQDILCKQYRGIVEPQLRYCCSFWGACGGTELEVLQKLQNRAATIVTDCSYDSSASVLMKTLKSSTVADMIKMETACMVYKSVNDLPPDFLSDIFTKTRHAVGKICETPQLISRSHQ